MPRPACSASRCASSYFRFEYCGQSKARPLRTSQSPSSAPPTEHVATVRPYRSSEIGRQFTGRRAMKASSSFAALAPHLYWRLSSPRQSWLLSGASIPHSRIRVPCICSVSPSMTLACPARLSAAASEAGAIGSAPRARLSLFWSSALGIEVDHQVQPRPTARGKLHRGGDCNWRTAAAVLRLTGGSTTTPSQTIRSTACPLTLDRTILNSSVSYRGNFSPGFGGSNLLCP